MFDLEFERLVLQDFKNYQGTQYLELNRKPGVYFVKGVNEIYPELGGNGAGKSTLWDAVLWCLWGSTGRDLRPADSIQTWGKAKPNTRVSLFLKVKGESVEIRRQRKPNLLTIARGTTTVVDQSEVSKLLGLTESAFARAVIMGQFGSMFLDLKAEQQSSIFNDVLRLDEWVRASAAASERLKKLRADQEDATVELKVAQTLSESLKSEVDGFEQDNNQWAERHAQACQEIKAELTSEKKKQVKIVDKLSLLTKPLLNFEYNGEVEALSQVVHGKLISLSSVRKDIKDTLRELMTLDEAAVRLKDKGVCDACGQPLTDKKLLAKLVKESQLKITKHQSKIEELTAKEASLQNTHKAAEAKVNAFKIKESLARAEFSKLESEYNECEKSLNQSNWNISALQSKLEKEQKAVNPFIDLLKRKQELLVDVNSKIATSQLNLEKIEGLVFRVKAWSDGFKEIRLSIIDEVLSELEFAVMSNAEVLGLEGWRIEFNTQRELSSGSSVVGFNVLLYPPEASTPIKWESYSGGESQRWQIATALGLSEVLLGRAGLSTNLLVLDEPTKGLSPEGVEALLESLKLRAESLSQVIFFCDHHSFNQGVFSGQVVVTKTDQGSFINRPLIAD